MLCALTMLQSVESRKVEIVVSKVLLALWVICNTSPIPHYESRDHACDAEGLSIF